MVYLVHKEENVSVEKLVRMQVSDDFEEARISSRGFGILDVGYRSKVSQLPSLHLLGCGEGLLDSNVSVQPKQSLDY
jgi:hypothetical protein